MAALAPLAPHPKPAPAVKLSAVPAGPARPRFRRLVVFTGKIN